MKRFFHIQIIILIAATLFAWWTVVSDFMRFYGYEGTIFKIHDCIIPNPVVTPCFYGAWAFLISLIWAIHIARQKNQRRSKHQKRLVIFLIAGTLFAWGNNTYELIKFFSNQEEPTIGCSGQLVTNPYITPCFIGAVLFLLALIIGVIVYYRLVHSLERTTT